VDVATLETTVVYATSLVDVPRTVVAGSLVRNALLKVVTSSVVLAKDSSLAEDT
jgi:hypothetical protein